VQASYFERFHWPILNFWTLQTVEHDGNHHYEMELFLDLLNVLKQTLKTFVNLIIE
jgi:hypothetical protein